MDRYCFISSLLKITAALGDRNVYQPCTNDKHLILNNKVMKKMKSEPQFHWVGRVTGRKKFLDVTK